MELAILVYIASIVPKLSVFCDTAIIIGGMTFVCYLMWAVQFCDTIHIRLPVISLLALSVLSIMLPSEKVMYTMAGAYATQQVITDPATKRIGAKVITLIESKLEELATTKK